VDRAKNDIKKIAVVSHDYNVVDRRGLYDYSEHLARINKLCDHQGCDTILYALYTWTEFAGRKNAQLDLQWLNHVQRIVLEVGKPPDSFDNVEVWVRERMKPIVAQQRFARSGDSVASKRLFISDLASRHINTTLLVICGETNIACLKQDTKSSTIPTVLLTNFETSTFVSSSIQSTTT